MQAPTQTHCENIVFDYTTGEMICADTGEVLAEHLPAIFLGINETSPAKATSREARYQERIARIETRSKIYATFRKVVKLIEKYENGKKEIVVKIVEELKKEIENGNPTPTYAVSAKLGCSISFARRVMQSELGMAFTEKELEMIRKVINGELSTWDVAKTLGVSPKTVYNWVRKARQMGLV